LLLSAILAASAACSSPTDDDDHCIEVGDNLPDRDWIAISTGSLFACGLMADGEVISSVGAVVRGTTRGSAPRVQVPSRRSRAGPSIRAASEPTGRSNAGAATRVASSTYRKGSTRA